MQDLLFFINWVPPYVMMVAALAAVFYAARVVAVAQRKDQDFKDRSLSLQTEATQLLREIATELRARK